MGDGKRQIKPRQCPAPRASRPSLSQGGEDAAAFPSLRPRRNVLVADACITSGLDECISSLDPVVQATVVGTPEKVSRDRWDFLTGRRSAKTTRWPLSVGIFMLIVWRKSVGPRRRQTLPYPTALAGGAGRSRGCCRFRGREGCDAPARQCNEQSGGQARCCPLRSKTLRVNRADGSDNDEGPNVLVHAVPPGTEGCGRHCRLRTRLLSVHRNSGGPVRSKNGA